MTADLTENRNDDEDWPTKIRRWSPKVRMVRNGYNNRGLILIKKNSKACSCFVFDLKTCLSTLEVVFLS